MEDTNVNPKCTACKCYWKPDETDVKPSGLVCRTCKRCRDISKAKNKKYREENPDRVKEYRQIYYSENAKKLKQQQKIYNEENADKIKEYHKKYYDENTGKIKEYKKKYREENADIIKEYRQIYYSENAEKLIQQQKIYSEENADKIKEYKKNYREDNIDKIKEYHKKYYDENKCEHNKRIGVCSQCNPPLYLLNLQRGSLRRCLKNANIDKTKPTIAYLGCDAVYFNDYIQKKMDIYNETAEIKMDFTNIHLDHIKPVSAFNLDDEEEFLDCTHYTNFQPLLAKDNLTKFNKWNEENETYWNDNIKGKEYYNIYL